MSLPIVFIIVICIMSIFAFAIFYIVKKNRISFKQTVDAKPVRAYKNGERE